MSVFKKNKRKMHSREPDPSHWPCLSCCVQTTGAPGVSCLPGGTVFPFAQGCCSKLQRLPTPQNHILAMENICPDLLTYTATAFLSQFSSRGNMSPKRWSLGRTHSSASKQNLAELLKRRHVKGLRIKR